MRISLVTLAALCVLSLTSWAQTLAPEPGPDVAGPVTAAPMGPQFQKKVLIRRDLGRWWKDPATVKKLQLNDGQITQLDQIFYEHRLKLIDYGAAMEKEDLKLQNLLDADVPNEGQISAQVDQVLAARGKLEREYTMMSLDLRKVLSLDQWRQLRTIREETGPKGNMFFYKQLGPAPVPPGTPLPPPPPPGDMF